MAEGTIHNRDKEREAEQGYLINRIISISNISRDDLSWNNHLIKTAMNSQSPAAES
jgi:hypothetical protein